MSTLHQNKVSFREYSEMNTDAVVTNIEKWRGAIDRIREKRYISLTDKALLNEMLDHFNCIIPKEFGLKRRLNSANTDITNRINSTRTDISSLLYTLEILCVFSDEQTHHKGVRNHVTNSLSVYVDAGMHFIGGHWGKKYFCKSFKHETRIFKRDHKDTGVLKNNFITMYCEFSALVYAARIWGHLWKNENVIFHLDNIFVVWLVQGLFPHSKIVEQHRKLLVELDEMAKDKNFTYNSRWITSSNNKAADALASGKLVRFKYLLPDTEENTTAEREIGKF